MTQEEKAKAYDEAIERAKYYYDEGKTLGYADDIASGIFPELKESDDERVRKSLLEYLHTLPNHYAHGGVCVPEWISWLEKQGEHAKFRDSIQVGDKVTRNQDGVLVNLSQLNRVAKKDEKQGKNNIGISEATKKKLEDNLNKALEKETPESLNEFLDKQGEQKPIDKVEPKFKVGNKIYLKPEYRMPDDDTPIANTVFEIKAIDDKHYRFDSSYIFIEDQDKYELVEQKTAEDVNLPEFESYLCLMLQKFRTKGMCTNGEIIDFVEEHSQKLRDILEKPVWSEEYNKIIEEIINDIECARAINYHAPKEGYEFRENWLKSLKDRVQPKQEWSEEDEEILDTIVCELEEVKKTLTEISYPAYDRLIAWLKSLRPQSTWKPSDEQMHYLSWIANIKLGDSVVEQEVSKRLNGLLEDLKKLRGE